MIKPVIMQVVPELTTGGAELSTIEMASAVQRSGGRAIVVAQSGDMIGDLKQTGATYIQADVASKNPAVILKNSSVLQGLIKKHNVSLIHARSRAPAWSAYLASKKAAIPYLTTYHGAYGEKNIFKKMYNKVMVKGKLTIANSAYVQNLVSERYNLPKKQIPVIYRGVDFTNYDPALISQKQKQDLRDQWGAKPDQNIFLLAARLSPIKGHKVVIEAVSQLKQKGILGDSLFIFAGGDRGRDEYVRSLKDLIKQNGLNEHIKLVGHVRDMVCAYAIAQLSLSTSLVPETFGRTGVEAQAMECPIIATILGAPQETCLAEPKTPVANITGWLTKPDDPVSLSKALESVLSLSEQERVKIGQRARAHVLHKFPVSQMQRQTLEVYDQLLGCQLEEGFVKALKT